MTTQKIAYVTGGMGGIGTAICQALAKAGHLVVAAHTPSKDPQEWLDNQQQQGFNFIASSVDVSDFESCKQAMQAIIQQYGSIDILINNAGITRDTTFQRMSHEQWHDVINTNLHGAFNTTKQVLDSMLKNRWGRIINIASVNAQRGQFGQTNYAASKAGLHGFSMSLALELSSRGITVNTVSPGYIDTDMVKAIPEDILNKIVAQVPVKRLGKPQEIASMVAWLSSEDGAFATGADFSVNGGMYTH